MNHRILACLVLVLAGGLFTCQNPIDGVKIGLKDPIERGVVEIRLYDPANNPRPTDNRVKVAGPDANRVVTTLNTTKYKVNPEGVLLLAPAPETVLSTQQPFRFTAVVETNGYLTVLQPMVLTNPGRVGRSVRQISQSKPPRSLLPARSSGSADASGSLSAELTATTNGPTADAWRATVVLPTGTKLTDRDGQAVGGPNTLQVLYVPSRYDDALGYVPGGGILSNVAGLPGKPALGSMRVLSLAGSVALELFNESYQLATQLAPAARWTMEINPATTNAVTGRVVQPGDSIPLYSYDTFLNRWQAERPGVVTRNAQTGKLEYVATASRVAAYVAAWTESVCDEGPVFSVTSKLANVDVNYRCELIDADNGQRVTTFYANVNNGALIRISNQRSGRRLKLRIYDETDAWGKGTNGGLIAESAVGQACEPKPIPVSLAELPVPPVIKLALDFRCPAGKTLDEASLPAQIITQYSEVGKESWRSLITATRTARSVTSFKLQTGRRYDFRASTDGGATWPLRENNYLVEQSQWTLKINLDSYCK